MTSGVDSPDRTAGRLRMAVFGMSSVALAALIAGMVLPNTAVPLVTRWGGPHTIHEVAFTLFAVMALLGLAAQIRRPRQHVAAMTLVGGFLVLLGIGSAVTGFLFPPALIMLALAIAATASHPASRRLLTSVTARCRATLRLAGVASIGWPTHASSLGVGWGLVAVAWGVTVGGVSLAAHRRLAGGVTNLSAPSFTEVVT